MIVAAGRPRTKGILAALPLIFAAAMPVSPDAHGGTEAPPATDRDSDALSFSAYLTRIKGVRITRSPSRLPEAAGQGDLKMTRYADVDTGAVFHMAVENFGEKLTDRAKGMSLYFGQAVFQFVRRGDEDFCSLTEAQSASINRLTAGLKTLFGDQVRIAGAAPHSFVLDRGLFFDPGPEALIDDIPACGDGDAEKMKQRAKQAIFEPIVQEMLRQGHLRLRSP